MQALIKSEQEIRADTRSLESIPSTELLAADATSEIAELIEVAKGWEEIDSAEAQGIAVGIIGDLRKLYKCVDELGEKSYRPWKSVCDKISTERRTALAPLKTEIDRLTKLVGTFQANEERKAQARADQIRKELAALNPTPAPAGVPQSQEDQLAAALTQRKSAALVNEISAPVASTAVKTKMVWRFRVKGDNLSEINKNALLAANAFPHYFDITPKVSIICSALSAVDGQMQIPGLEIFQEAQTRIR